MSRASSASTSYPPTALQPMSVHSHTSLSRHASPHPHKLAYGASFFCLGLLNNVLYVIILSAALDLVDKATTPKVSSPDLELGGGGSDRSAVLVEFS